MGLMAARWFVAAVLALSCAPSRNPPGVEPDASSGFDTRADRLACTYTGSLPIVPRDADVLLLFDRSGSMSTEFGAESRYTAAFGLLSDWAVAYQKRLRFGYQEFPARGPCGDALDGCCASAPTVSPAVETAASVVAALANAAPVSGNTPTATALKRARQHFETLQDGVVDRFVLLATDGRPSCGADGRLAEADAFDAQGSRIAGACYDALLEADALLARGIKLIVLGVGPGLDGDPSGHPSCLDDMARRGGFPRPGGRPAFFSAQDPGALEQALQEIFGAISPPSCDVVLETFPADPNQVAVFFDGQEVPRNQIHGWSFSGGDARRIRLFGDSCRRLERFQVTSIDVRFGCPPCPDESTCG